MSPYQTQKPFSQIAWTPVWLAQLPYTHDRFTLHGCPRFGRTAGQSPGAPKQCQIGGKLQTVLQFGAQRQYKLPWHSAPSGMH